MALLARRRMAVADTTFNEAAGASGGIIVNDRPLALRWSRDGKLQYARHWHDTDTRRQGHEWVDVPTEEQAAAGVGGTPK